MTNLELKKGNINSFIFFLLLFVGVICLFVRYIIPLAVPQKMSSVMNWEASEVSACYVIQNKSSGPATELQGERLNEFYRIMDGTDVKYRDAEESMPVGAIEYKIYFRTKEDKTISFSICDCGYFFCNRRRYDVQNGEAILTFLAKNI